MDDIDWGMTVKVFHGHISESDADRIVYMRRVLQTDVSIVASEFQRQAAAASSVRHLPGHRSRWQPTIQIRLSQVVLGCCRTDRCSIELTALSTSRLAFRRRPAGSKCSCVVRETQTDQQCSRQQRRTCTITAAPHFTTHTRACAHK